MPRPKPARRKLQTGIWLYEDTYKRLVKAAHEATGRELRRVTISEMAERFIEAGLKGVTR